MLLVYATIISQIPHVEASGGLTLDGNGYGSNNGSSNPGNCMWSKWLTTKMKPDVIVAMLVVNDTTTTLTGTGVTDNASLNWHLRMSQKGPANVQIFYYYAIASTLLSADNVTFVLSSRAVATVCQDFGISGADINSPFDPNKGLPDTHSGNSTTTSLTFNTYNPNDFLIILQGFCALGSAGSGSPSGFTNTVPSEPPHVSSSNCAANSLQTNTYYNSVSAIQSSNTISWTFDDLYSQFAILGDAIQSTPGPLGASVIVGSNVVDVGQLASFSCAGSGGVRPYTYSWTFGDGNTGSGASTSHIYNTPGPMTVACTVTDALATTAKDSTEETVVTDPTVTVFTASPESLLPGDKVTLMVSASGGYGALSYSYANLPPGCLSTNATSLSCYPTSSGNYRVTVTVTDRAMESANATAIITVGPHRVLGLPQTVGLAVLFGTTGGIGAIAILSVALALRRKKRHQTLTTT
jgi:hypothetical protein